MNLETQIENLVNSQLEMGKTIGYKDAYIELMEKVIELNAIPLFNSNDRYKLLCDWIFEAGQK